MAEKDNKAWTPQEIAAFAIAAKARGIIKEKLAKDHLGIHSTTLSDWISGKQEPKPYHKKLLSCIEPKILRMKVVE